MAAGVSHAETLKRKAKAGEVTQIHGGMFFKGKASACEGNPRSYRVIREPKLGQLISKNNTRPIRRVGKTRYSHCIGKSVEMGNLYYKAGDKPGLEQITVRTQNSSGRDFNLVFRITVK